jgi:hypothetical protein
MEPFGKGALPASPDPSISKARHLKSSHVSAGLWDGQVLLIMGFGRRGSRRVSRKQKVLDSSMGNALKG